MSIDAAAKPQRVTSRRARCTSPGPRLCWPPPWPSRISGRGPAAPAGDHSTPGMSPRLKSCSLIPSEVVTVVSRMGRSLRRPFFHDRGQLRTL